MIAKYLLIVLIAIFQAVLSQSVINVGNDFLIPDTTKVPFGKKILLKGKSDKSILSIKVNWMYGINEGSKEATITDGSWSVVLGPFPAGESVIIQYRVARTISKDTLNKYVSSTLDKFAFAMAENEISMSDEELTNYIKTVLVQSTAIEYKRIQTPSGMTLFDLIINSIGGRLAQDQRIFVNALWRKEESKDEIVSLQNGIKKFIESPEYDSLMKQIKIISPKDTAVIKTFTGTYFSEALNKGDAEAFKEILSKPSLTNKPFIELTKNRISELLDQYAAYKESSEIIKTIITDKIEKTVSDLQLISEYSSSFESSVTISDLEYYAGFDIGYFIVSDQNVYPFFTVNIYPHKVEINKDPQGLWERLSLSGGIAIKSADIPSNGMVYMLGLGFRMNKLFRITAGTAFYQDITTKKIKGEYTAGLSLNFRYITDLLQIANGATANYQSE